jgi:hypothetical protein
LEEKVKVKIELEAPINLSRFPMKISYKLSALAKNFAVLKEIKSDLEIFRATGFKEEIIKIIKTNFKEEGTEF